MDILLTQKELAERWGISERWIEKLREKGTGPAFVPLHPERDHKPIRYRLADVLAYEEARKKGNDVPEPCKKAMRRASDCLQAVSGWSGTGVKARAVIENVRSELNTLIGET